MNNSRKTDTVVEETVKHLDSFHFRLRSEYVKEKINLKANISEWIPKNILPAKTDFSDTNVTTLLIIDYVILQK